MTKAMNCWICDACGAPIGRVSDGMVQWINFQHAKPGRSLRLVHADNKDIRHCCRFDPKVEQDRDGGFVADVHLAQFVGPDGLMDLLEKLSEKSLPADQLIEMIKRLHVPGYEWARNHLKEAIEQGVFQPNTEFGFPSGKQIDAVIA